jgi:hypothetical protein
MKSIEKFPLPLEKISDDLKEMNVSAIVEGATIDRDDGVTLTLTVKIEDLLDHRKTPEEIYDDAMKVLEVI